MPMSSSRADEIPGRVTVGLAAPLFFGFIMYDLSNEPDVSAAPSPFWVVPLFFAAGVVVGLLWPTPTSDDRDRRLSSSATGIIAAAGAILIGTLLAPSSEVIYWAGAVATTVVVAIMTASVKSARRASRKDEAE
jgi:NADH:ubiquinone oxidoreductase subunit 6 (subunit J)